MSLLLLYNDLMHCKLYDMTFISGLIICYIHSVLYESNHIGLLYNAKFKSHIQYVHMPVYMI